MDWLPRISMGLTIAQLSEQLRIGLCYAVPGLKEAYQAFETGKLRWVVDYHTTNFR